MKGMLASVYFIVACIMSMVYRYLDIPQWKSKADHLKSKVITANKQLVELEKRLKESTAFRGIVLDETSNCDFLIMEENDASIHKKFKEGTFQRIFWQQQFQAA